MSSCTYTWTCIGSDTPALATLHAQLEAAISTPFEAWAAPLHAIFDLWDEPVVLRVSWLGSALRCVMDTSAHDEMEKEQLQALQAAGVEYLRVRVFNSQVGESATSYHQGSKRIAAKAFPMPTLPESERLYELILDGKDASFAKKIKAGASPNTLVDGQPVYVHAMRAGQEKAIRALLAAPVEWSACLPWAGEVAQQIAHYGGSKAELLLRNVLTAPGADVVVLARQEAVMGAVCRFPKLLQWVLTQPGVDVNAPLYMAETGVEGGSLLFHSVELFKDDPRVLALLDARGARSIPAAHLTDFQRLFRMYWRYRDAETPAQLAAAGVDLEVPLWSDYSVLRSAMRSASHGGHYLRLVQELLDLGASTACWMRPATFQREVLAHLLNAEEHALSRLIVDNEVGGAQEAGFSVDGDGPLVVGVLRRLLERGLDTNLVVCLAFARGTQPFQARARDRLRYRGNVLGAVACLLCGRGSALRPLCLPLVELLLAHGASPHGVVERVDGPWQEGFDDVGIEGDWAQIAGGLEGTGSVLERLVQRNAQAPDSIDAAVIAALSARA